MNLKQLAKLKTGWRWLKMGEVVNPKSDYHCYPPGSGKDLKQCEESYTVTAQLQGMLLRYEHEIIMSHHHLRDVSK